METHPTSPPPSIPPRDSAPKPKPTTAGAPTAITPGSNIFFNAAEVEADGVDSGATYFFPESNLGEISIKFNATHMLKYEIPINGKTTDVVGLFNHDNFARSLPETKANTAFRWARGVHKASLTARYISSYKTTKANPIAGYSQGIDSQMTWDMQYSLEFAIAEATARVTSVSYTHLTLPTNREV